ncbi:amino acid permease [Parvularcula flava]|uniref:Amino acid permease n=1 Tax=Aquisalinus luteolus TaxID=1566827 RepID=A0A8J3ERW2_9PROT|nr:amino acid permease [Aquisalinus luteolus]NHK28609.1 amino acid permease [Aquisalinus luteolus]GGH98991.1 amino acid transporter [Aquisalinus luteolus]
MENSDTPAPKLSRSISLPWLVFYGVGTILGAGIFVVIGKVIGEAGALTPIAYLIAGLVAFATALSYAEIAARIPTAGGPIDYVERASGLKHLGSLAGWGLVAANTVSAATITSGFIGYLGVFIDLPDWLVAIGIIIALASLAAVGMKASTMFMAMTTIIGMVTLVAVVWAVRDGLAATPVMLAEELGGISSMAAIGLFGGTFLALYSFIGFGDMVLTAEEVKKVEKTLPRAIVIAFAIVFVFYLLVSSAVVGAGPTEQIAEAEAPLVAVVERAGWPAWPVGIASLFIIVNGALTQIIGAARLLMDIGRDGRGAPGVFGQINQRTGTPVVATIAIGTIVMLLAVFVPLKQLAEATSLIILIVFAAVNLSLLALKAKSQPDGVPNMWIGVPIIGAVTSAGAVATQILLWVS